MRMNGSMDKREFDGGNPQQDAPRRVEKKRIWTRRRLLWLGIVAAVLLAVVAVSLLWQRGTFDGLRRRPGVSVRVPVRVAGGGLQQPHPADG